VDQGKELIKLALFGQPVKSSLSPAIHRMFAVQVGLDIEYRLIEPEIGHFPRALEEFRSAGGVGCNITLPFKRDAWKLAAGASPEVSQAQAANTLVLQESGWFAHTTDGAGLIADLTGNHGLGISGLRVLILGAGGAAAGILGSLLAENPQQIILVNRNLERARSLSERFEASGKVSVTSWSELSGQSAFNLVINATSLGHKGEAPPINTSSFAEGGLCYDMNYFKASQPLKKLCEDMHRPYIDGLGMLVEQAAKSFSIWTSKMPKTPAVIEAVRREAG